MEIFEWKLTFRPHRKLSTHRDNVYRYQPIGKLSHYYWDENNYNLCCRLIGRVSSLECLSKAYIGSVKHTLSCGTKFRAWVFGRGGGWTFITREWRNIYLFSRGHATVHLAVSIGPPVHPSILNIFLSVIGHSKACKSEILLYAYCSSVELYYCPCPTFRDF